MDTIDYDIGNRWHQWFGKFTPIEINSTGFVFCLHVTKVT